MQMVAAEQQQSQARWLGTASPGTATPGRQGATSTEWTD